MIGHKSDCVVHNMPGMPVSRCDCGFPHPSIVALVERGWVKQKEKVNED
jgi:hypothetical protein